MKKAQIRIAILAFLLPVTVLAFETVDTLPWPSDGRFPAYGRDELRPTRLWVQTGLMRDDNFLRNQSGGQGETVMRTGLGFRTEQRVIGRQRLILEGSAAYYSFQEFENLDHLAYSLAGTWAWEVGNDLSGAIILGRDYRLIDLSEIQAARSELIKTTRLVGTAGYMVTPNFRVRGALGTTWGERSTRADVETRGFTWSAGAEYVTPLRNTIGLEYRATNGDAPVPELIAPLGTFVNNDFHEREFALVAGYSPGPALRTDWRIGRTERTYTEVQGRDFSGTTYRMRAAWDPGAKTILAFDAYREPRSILDVAAGHVLVTGLAFGPSWAATNKLVFSARVLRDRRQFQGDPNLILVSGTVLRDEIVHGYRFGVGWEPQRQWQVGVSLDHGTRDSNVFGRSYRYTAATANLAWRYY